MLRKISWASIDMFWLLINGLIVVAMIGSIFGIGVLLRSSNAIIPSRTITVSGEGEVSVAPDLATIMFAVVSQGENPEAIQKVNTEKINKAIDFLKQQGSYKNFY